MYVTAARVTQRRYVACPVITATRAYFVEAHREEVDTR